MAALDSIRVDSWAWAIRLYKTRSLATAASRAGHIRVNGDRAKAAQTVRVGDEVRARIGATERIVVVRRIIAKRVGASVAVDCFTDNTPTAPPRESVALPPSRERGAGRPTKRERRDLDRLRRR